MKLVLVIPPVAKPSEPTPGALYLAAALGGRGLHTAVVDANLVFHEALWDPRRLERAAAGRRDGLARRALARAPRAARALGDPGTYRQAPRYRAALRDLGLAYRLWSQALGCRITPSDLDIPELSPLRSGDLARVASEPEQLPVAPLLEPAVEEILGHDPDAVGLSVTFLSQALGASALAGLLRRAGYRGRLFLGGALATAWSRRISPDSPALGAWDAWIAGPGEHPLEALLRGNPDSPGVMAPRLGVWRPAPSPAPAVLPPSERYGNGAPWERYLAPGPVVPVAASRGCYWRRCRFCPETARGGPFRAPPPDVLARWLRAVAARLGARWIHFTDEAIPPSALRALAHGGPGGPVRWYGFVRPERFLADPSLADDLARSGCAMLQLGIETASQDLLDRMCKGTRAEHAGPIVRALAGSGIRTHVYLLFGLPGQQRSDAEATARWVREHAPWITYLNLAVFHLPRGSPLEAHWGGPEPHDGPDLSLYRPIREDRAWPRRAVRAFLGELRGDPAIGGILARTPWGFTSNHGAFAPA